MPGRIEIDDVSPVVSGGRFPAKAVVGEVVPVCATVWREGHEAVAATLVVRYHGSGYPQLVSGPVQPEPVPIETVVAAGPRVRPRQQSMTAGRTPDVFHGQFVPDTVGLWTFRVDGWGDPISSWRHAVTVKLEAGQSVLVHAGAGGVGHFAVQLAKWKGAKVYATASKDKLAFVKELGADVVIDYQAQKFEDVVSNVDVVFDMVGGETQARSLAVLKKNGFLVSIVGAPPKKELDLRVLRGAGILLKPDAAELKQIAELVDAGKVKPHVSATFPLADAAKALALSKEGHAVGKIAIEVVPAPKK